MKKITLLFLMCFTSLSLFAQTFTGGTGPITDNNCDATHDFPVTVSGVGVLGTTNNFGSVGFSITHTWDSDLDIYLVAPDGITIVELSSDNGGSGDNYTNTIISASGTSAITTGVAPFTGTYLPEGSLAILNGINADGTWILRVCDDAAGDEGSVDSWSISFVAVPLLAPSCAANPVSTPNATCGNFASTIAWDAAATATGYFLTVGTTSGGTDIVNNVDVGNVITYNLPTQSPATTYFWKVVPYNIVGSSTGCVENSYTTFATGCFCPSVPSSNDNLGVTNVLLNTTNFPNGDVTYFDNTATPVNFAQGLSATTQISFATGFTYKADIWIDFNNDLDFNDAGELVQTGILSTNVNPTVLDATFVMPLTAPLGQHRMRIGTADDVQTPPDPCYSGPWGVTLDFTVNIILAPSDLPDYVNLQFPSTATFAQGGNVTVYARVYEGGLTDATSGQAPGVNAWVGISPVGSNTNPNTWTTWIPATFLGEVDNGFGNPTANDEYQASIGSSLVPGTYYYATRFQLNGGAFVYGGYTPSGGGFWDGTNNVSGVLTVTPPPPVTPNCDLASTLANPTLGGSTWNRPFADGSGLSGVGVGVSYHIYGPFNVDVTGSYTFTSTQDFDGFIFVYQNAFDPNDQLTNYVAGNDDSGPGSVITTNLNSGTNYYFITTSFAPADFGTFSTVITGAGTATCGTLANPGFDNTNFTYYPNPVKNTLNLSYNQEISNVEVFNLLGQKVSSNTVNANLAQIDMSNLSKGAYLVRVTSNNQVKTIKVIKE